MKCLWKYLYSISIVSLLLALDLAEGLKLGEKGVCKLNTTRKNPTRKVKDRPVCCQHYIYKNNICEPECNIGCERGTCVEPNVCQCERPLVLSREKNRCIEPVCEPACFRAVCESTDLCTCHADHVAINGTHCAPTCREGFRNDPVDLECRPICSRPCIKGLCTAPETCVCEAGYQLSAEDKYTCTLPCASKCVDDDCKAPKLVDGVCSCDDGFYLDDYSCLPIVNTIECKSCNGSCLGDKCHCSDGKSCFNDMLPAEPVEVTSLNTPKIGCKSCNGSCLEEDCHCGDGRSCFFDPLEPVEPVEILTPKIACHSCNGSCITVDNCYCGDGNSCYFDPLEPVEPAEFSPPKMAGLELTWFVAGAVGLLLLVAIAVVMFRIWRNRKMKQDEICDNGRYDRSVVYTVPNTLIQQREETSNVEEEESAFIY